MDFVPLTIFFLACLMSYHGNLAAPSVCAVDNWPDICADQSFCFTKPEGYPNAEKISKMVDKAGIKSSDIILPLTNQRSGDNMCSVFSSQAGKLYMIKDDRDGIRYVIQDTRLVSIDVETIQCNPTQIDLPPNAECRQNYTTIMFPVTKCDGTGVELIPFTYPSACFFMKITDDK